MSFPAPPFAHVVLSRIKSNRTSFGAVCCITIEQWMLLHCLLLIVCIKWNRYLTFLVYFVQLQSIIEFLQTFVYLFEDPENSMLRPVKYHLCQHMVLQPDCVYSRHPTASRMTTSDVAGSPSNTSTTRMMCPTSDDLKYRFVRLSIDCIDLYLVESGTALNVQVSDCPLT